jgi:hypothetical protein
MQTDQVAKKNIIFKLTMNLKELTNKLIEYSHIKLIIYFGGIFMAISLGYALTLLVVLRN